MLPDHLKGRNLHFCGPDDEYDEEEDNGQEDAEEVDSQFDQMEVP